MVNTLDCELGEQFVVIDDPESGAKGVIAIHSTSLGPAAGGCRFWNYADQDALATDALRLARGMTYKNAIAGLPFGGGKAVLQRPEGAFDRAAMFRAFGRAVEKLGGQYVTAEDVGTTIADMRAIAEETRHVAGLDKKPGFAGGDPSPWTALGIFKSMQAASRVSLGSDVRGLTVALQGTGNVGSHLAQLLHDAGARLVLADADPARAEALAARFGGRVVAPDEILAAEAEIFAPCALGAVLNDKTIPVLRARLICGGANNQLATEQDGARLAERGIAYAPDYVVNAGGIINVVAEYLGETEDQVGGRIDLIAERLGEILATAESEGRPSHVVADEMAQKLVARGRLVEA
ncbi:Glu/Leu/Phe/Val family dehydrogenase [Novosphingobium clariflavum]|uniref:Glu/Leu/Phe/Val dehydrogenase n=1 Tax=Novosphingobium clariflavum TaxID=2029884 RepID=A0ABV6SDL9_9SPHN|nr:Glu/Leu/Phe/Val dehydrogenase dimerization domain-containing protein [Novosphingobium clariflavum]